MGDIISLLFFCADWLTLQEHKIYGSLIGTPATAPRQIAENGLPVVLMPEEVTFILEKGIGKIYRYKKERDFPSETIKREYENFLDENKRQQVGTYSFFYIYMKISLYLDCVNYNIHFRQNTIRDYAQNKFLQKSIRSSMEKEKSSSLKGTKRLKNIQNLK